MKNKKNKALTQSMYYVLLSLTKPRHGYEIMQYISDITKKRVSVGPGTLYALLPKFEEDGYIKMISTDDNKKTYLITDAGQEILNEEINRLRLLLSDGETILKGCDNYEN